MKKLLIGLFGIYFALSSIADPLDALLDEVSPDDSLKGLVKKVGPAPSDAEILEAEQLKFTSGAWMVVDCPDAFNRFNGAASAGKVLRGISAKQGEISGTFEIPEKKPYRLWVRYIDDNRKGSRDALAFTVKVFQNKKMIAEKTFDEKHIPRQHDRYFRYDLQWDFVDFPAAKGKITFFLTKKNTKKSESEQGRSIDCFVLTSHLNYQPHVSDFHPVYTRGIALAKQSEPIRLTVAGIKLDKNMPGNKRNELFSAGESSRWVYLSEYLKEEEKKSKGGMHRFSAGVPINPYARGNVKPHYFKIQFSTKPNEKGVFAEILHEEPGIQHLFRLDPASLKFESDIDWSAESLANSRKHPAPDGKHPMKFPFGGTLNLSEEMWSSKAIENELTTQQNLGLNECSPALWNIASKYGFSKNYSDAEFMFHLTKGCICTPDLETMNKVMEKKIGGMKNTGTVETCRSMGVMDEPAFGVSHVIECAEKTGKCTEKFIGYLKNQKVTPAELGLKDLSEAKLSRELKDGALFYWSVRYRNHVLTEFFRTCTQIVATYAPNIRTRVNIATELVTNGNMVQFGVDWFEVFNTGALTSGETEDWSNLMPTYQVAAYIMDTMRGACRRNNIPFEMLNILGGRSSWEIQAKGFSEIGRGATGMGFFRYGPTYSGSSDSVSHVPAMHEAIKNITFPTGAVEDILLSGKVARGDAAMLLSVTGDIWQILTFSNPYGRERMWLHLLLTHLGLRLDILGEEDLRDELPQYKYLFVTDANIRREYLPSLLKWIKSGGTLIMTAGALSADEYNAPLGFDEASGLKRGVADVNAKTLSDQTNDFGTLEGEGFSIKLANGVQKLENGTPLLSNPWGGNLLSVFPCGNGKIVACGFMPGMSYIKSQSKNPEGKFLSDRIYPEDGRNLMKLVLSKAGLTPAVYTDNFLVEAIFLNSPSADLVTLSNWSGKNQGITLSLPDGKYKKVELVPGKISGQSVKDGILRIQLEIGAGGYVVLKK